MTGAEIFALLKDGGPWGLLALVLWRWFKALDDIRAADAARLQDAKDTSKELGGAVQTMVRGFERMEEFIKEYVRSAKQ